MTLTLIIVALIYSIFMVNRCYFDSDSAFDSFVWINAVLYLMFGTVFMILGMWMLRELEKVNTEYFHNIRNDILKLAIGVSLGCLFRGILYVFLVVSV